MTKKRNLWLRVSFLFLKRTRTGRDETINRFPEVEELRPLLQFNFIATRLTNWLFDSDQNEQRDNRFQVRSSCLVKRSVRRRNNSQVFSSERINLVPSFALRSVMEYVLVNWHMNWIRLGDWNGKFLFDVHWIRLLHHKRDFDVFHDFNRIRVWNFEGDLLRLGNWNLYLLRDFDWHRMRDWNCCNYTTSGGSVIFIVARRDNPGCHRETKQSNLSTFD